MTIPQLYDKYPEIVRYGRELGSFESYITNELRNAEKDGAPTNAVYYDSTNEKWITTDDIAARRAARTNLLNLNQAPTCLHILGQGLVNQLWKEGQKLKRELEIARSQYKEAEQQIIQLETVLSELKGQSPV